MVSWLMEEGNGQWAVGNGEEGGEEEKPPSDLDPPNSATSPVRTGEEQEGEEQELELLVVSHVLFMWN